jgi:hypothetical protein
MKDNRSAAGSVKGFAEGKRIRIGDFWGLFTLIVGEVNQGKTSMTHGILDTYLRDVGGKVTIVDLAPRILESDLGGKPFGEGVGSRIRYPGSRSIRYFAGEIKPPRLRAGSDEEAMEMASENARTIEALFREAFEEEIEALFINDCSLYMHAGDPSKMLDWARAAGTTVANGYFGKIFGQSKISELEEAGMKYLMDRCDRLIRL